MTVLSSHETEQKVSAEASIGPGARLRKERELQGLDQSRVAAQLHLSETLIEGLERDDFDALPGTVFTQGYLRNYARLLGLPESEIIAAYQKSSPEDPRDSLSAKGFVQIKQEVRSSHGLVQLATWLIVVGLVALLFIWWQGRFGWQDEAGEDFTPQAESLDDSLLRDEPLMDPPTDTSFAESYVTAPAIQEESAFGADSEPQTRLLDDAPSSEMMMEPEQTIDSEPSISTFEEDQARLEQQPPAVPEAIPEVIRDLPSEPQAEPLADGRLVIEFTGKCWAEVRDATGRAHIIGEKNAGTRYELESDLGPFKVILGNANVVSMTLNGRPYDLAAHTRGNVARFTLETSQSIE